MYDIGHIKHYLPPRFVLQNEYDEYECYAFPRQLSWFESFIYPQEAMKYTSDNKGHQCETYEILISNEFNWGEKPVCPSSGNIPSTVERRVWNQPWGGQISGLGHSVWDRILGRSWRASNTAPAVPLHNGVKIQVKGIIGTLAYSIMVFCRQLSGGSADHRPQAPSSAGELSPSVQVRATKNHLCGSGTQPSCHLFNSRSEILPRRQCHSRWDGKNPTAMKWQMKFIFLSEY